MPVSFARRGVPSHSPLIGLETKPEAPVTPSSFTIPSATTYLSSPIHSPSYHSIPSATHSPSSFDGLLSPLTSVCSVSSFPSFPSSSPFPSTRNSVVTPINSNKPTQTNQFDTEYYHHQYNYNNKYNRTTTTTNNTTTTIRSSRIGTAIVSNLPSPSSSFPSSINPMLMSDSKLASPASFRSPSSLAHPTHTSNITPIASNILSTTSPLIGMNSSRRRSIDLSLVRPLISNSNKFPSQAQQVTAPSTSTSTSVTLSRRNSLRSSPAISPQPPFHRQTTPTQMSMSIHSDDRLFSPTKMSMDEKLASPPFALTSKIPSRPHSPTCLPSIGKQMSLIQPCRSGQTSPRSSSRKSRSGSITQQQPTSTVYDFADALNEVANQQQLHTRPSPIHPERTRAHRKSSSVAVSPISSGPTATATPYSQFYANRSPAHMIPPSQPTTSLPPSLPAVVPSVPSGRPILAPIRRSSISGPLTSITPPKPVPRHQQPLPSSSSSTPTRDIASVGPNVSSSPLHAPLTLRSVRIPPTVQVPNTQSTSSYYYSPTISPSSASYSSATSPYYPSSPPRSALMNGFTDASTVMSSGRRASPRHFSRSLSPALMLIDEPHEHDPSSRVEDESTISSARTVVPSAIAALTTSVTVTPAPPPTQKKARVPLVITVPESSTAPLTTLPVVPKTIPSPIHVMPTNSVAPSAASSPTTSSAVVTPSALPMTIEEPLPIKSLASSKVVASAAVPTSAPATALFSKSRLPMGFAPLTITLPVGFDDVMDTPLTPDSEEEEEYTGPDEEEQLRLATIKLVEAAKLNQSVHPTPDGARDSLAEPASYLTAPTEPGRHSFRTPMSICSSAMTSGQPSPMQHLATPSSNELSSSSPSQATEEHHHSILPLPSTSIESRHSSISSINRRRREGDQPFEAALSEDAISAMKNVNAYNGVKTMAPFGSDFILPPASSFTAEVRSSDPLTDDVFAAPNSLVHALANGLVLPDAPRASFSNYSRAHYSDGTEEPLFVQRQPSVNGKQAIEADSSPTPTPSPPLVRPGSSLNIQLRLCAATKTPPVTYDHYDDDDDDDCEYIPGEDEMRHDGASDFWEAMDSGAMSLF